MQFRNPADCAVAEDGDGLLGYGWHAKMSIIETYQCRHVIVLFLHREIKLHRIRVDPAITISSLLSLSIGLTSLCHVRTRLTIAENEPCIHETQR
jgi:hypothetical protein